MVIDTHALSARAMHKEVSRGHLSKRAFAQQTLITVHHIGVDGMLHRGQIMVHDDLTTDVHDFFDLARQMEFPIQGVASSIEAAQWQPNNVTYGFGLVPDDTDMVGASLHAHGRALCVNPRQHQVSDVGAVVGVLTPDHPLVRLLVSRGWRWVQASHASAAGPVLVWHFEKP